VTARDALVVRAPDIGYGATHVLRDVALEVSAGEVVAVIGGNGCGKTALLRWIGGLLPRRGGRCLVAGVEVDSPRQAVASGVGLVVQDPNDQLLAATVEQDVELGPRNLRVAAPLRRTRVAAALAQVGMTALAERDIETLSLGERKRVALAGVLAMAPRLLLLDEPTAGLDPLAEDALCDTLRGLAATGVTQLIATHAIDLVAELASRVLVLGDGCVLGDGPPRQVLSDYALLRRARLRRPWPAELWAHALRERCPVVPLTLQEIVPWLSPAS
jgi:cobalt/nickel transport system ATP-binding protein